MDLAKIRQKARQEHESQLRGDHLIPATMAESSDQAPDVLPQARGQIEVDFYAETPVEQGYQQLAPQTTAHQRSAQRNPVEIILAGRESVGFNEDHPLTPDDLEQTVAAAYHEFLCFRVSDELYGINIMDIKELIKPREVTEVPKAPTFISGVISLRGTIIPIINMVDRLGLRHGTPGGRERIIVVRYGASLSGLLVDEIIQVVRIAPEALENTPTLLEGIDRDFVSGIGRSDGRMIILLNLANTVDIHLC